MRAGTTSWITGCSLWSRAGPPPRYVRSPGRACPAVALEPIADSRASLDAAGAVVRLLPHSGR